MSLLSRLWKGLYLKNENPKGRIMVSHYEGRKFDHNAYQRWWDASKHTTALLDALIEETFGMAGFLTEAQIRFDNLYKQVMGEDERKENKNC